MNSGIRPYPPADRIDVPDPLQATSTSASSRKSFDSVRRPLGVVELCPGRQPGKTCYRLRLPGFPVCPLGHALVPYTSPTIGLQPLT